MTEMAAERLGVSSREVLVCSTGIIGVELPMSLIGGGLGKIDLNGEGGHALARAMMTTDTRPKEAAVSFDLEGRTAHIGGVCKGSGMIHPDMATMLAFIGTDAAVEQDYLAATLREVADASFNMMTVDGDTSTNDALLVMANGTAQNSPINADSPGAAVFKEALLEVCTYLAKETARDGEGASKLITVELLGARDTADARKAARTIAASNLVKSAVYGADPNWGRVMMALGRSGAAAEEVKVDLFINGVCIMEAGKPIPYHRDAVVALMRSPEVTFRVNLNLGRWTGYRLGLRPHRAICNHQQRLHLLMQPGGLPLPTRRGRTRSLAQSNSPRFDFPQNLLVVHYALVQWKKVCLGLVFPISRRSRWTPTKLYES